MRWGLQIAEYGKRKAVTERDEELARIAQLTMACVSRKGEPPSPFAIALQAFQQHHCLDQGCYCRDSGDIDEQVLVGVSFGAAQSVRDPD